MTLSGAAEEKWKTKSAESVAPATRKYLVLIIFLIFIFLQNESSLIKI
jgi:hypothetical protein